MVTYERREQQDRGKGRETAGRTDTVDGARIHIASNLHGRAMTHPTKKPIAKDEAVQPPIVAIITRFYSVVVIIALRL